MKKILLSALVILMSIVVFAADGVPNMLFKTSDGAEHIIAATGLDIKFIDGNLVATNTTQSITLPLTSLVSMEFGGIASSISTTPAELTGAVTATNLNGIAAGTFASEAQAKVSLPAGIYILTAENGKTSKLIIRK